MTILTARQIAGHAQNAGFRGRDLTIAVAVGLAESGGRTNATNRNSNGSTDYGVWQINSVHADKLRTGTWSNPADNARMAFAVYREAGNSFRPWVAYTTGKYLAHMPAASRGAQTPDAGGTIPAGIPGTGSLADITRLGILLSDTRTYLRVGYWILGMMLIGYALMKMTGDNKLSGVTKSAISMAVTKKPVRA